MFAFALWDRKERRLQLVRDRFGEKPIYYSRQGTSLLFGSELKALRAHPGFAADVDRRALSLFFRFGYVPSPASILEGVHKLPPASVLTVTAGDLRERQPVAYWSALDVAIEPVTSGALDHHEEIDQLDELLRDATRIRMRADVPLGAFLSGGIDSSTVVALMQAEASGAVSTFTIGSTSRAHDESEPAAAVAAHLGTRHTELVVTPEEARSVIPQLPTVYDEPFADSSQIPSVLVAALARRDVTVSLSGDGGDEMFGGYERYRWVPRLARRFARVPSPLRRSAGRVAASMPPRLWEAVVAPLPTRVRPRIPATKVAKLSSLAPLDGASAMYRQLVSTWSDPTDVVVGVEPASTGNDAVAAMMALDTVTYLPDDILVKLDRATMSVGLEGRVPFLDHRIAEHMGRLPSSLKVVDVRSESLLERPKAGFGVPIGAWLRGPLREWADALLAPERLQREGYLRSEAVTAAWDDQRRGRRDRAAQIWTALMFQAWLEATTS
jgi:asparagine synthase (glutamine-hydrolysing)